MFRKKNKRDFVQSAKGVHNANCPSILRRGSARARTRASARARVFARFLMVRRRKRAIIKFREKIRVVVALRGLNKITFVSQKTNAISFNPRKAATTQIVRPFSTRERARAHACVRPRACFRAFFDGSTKKACDRQISREDPRCGRLTRIEHKRVCFAQNKRDFVQSA